MATQQITYKLENSEHFPYPALQQMTEKLEESERFPQPAFQMTHKLFSFATQFKHLAGFIVHFPQPALQQMTHKLHGTTNNE